MKTKILILLLPVYLFALEGYSPYKIYQATDTLTFQNLDSNIVRGSDWSDVIADTIEQKFVRFSDIDDSSFTQMSIDTVDADTVNVTGGIEATRLTADSATIPVFKGVETHRDSAYFAGGLRGLRLYFPQVDIDSLVGDVAVGGKLSILTGGASVGLKVNGGANLGVNIAEFGSGLSRNKIIVINDNGYLGVKDSTPEYPLDVTGDGRLTGALTANTLNTGNGDNELYAMNQNVRTTDDVTHNTLTATAGITIAGGTQITKCTTGTFQCSLYDDATYRTVVTAKFSVFGNSTSTVRRIWFPNLAGTCSSGSPYLKGFPSVLLSEGDDCRPVAVLYNNAAVITGYITIATSSVLLGGATFTGTCGLPETSITY